MTLPPPTTVAAIRRQGNTLTLSGGAYITADHGQEWRTDVNIVGSGVMIYLAPEIKGVQPGGSIDLSASNFVSMDLSAPISGTYSGILFFQDRNNSNPAEFMKNNGDFAFSGASYFPKADVSFAKNNGAGDFGAGDFSGNCNFFVAMNLDVKNNANINNNCGAFGGTPWKSVALAE